MGRRPRSLRLELLFNLVFLMSAAIILVGMSTLLLSMLGAGPAYWALGVLWLAMTAVFVLFGIHLIQRMVLAPLRELSDQVDALAMGDFTPAGPGSSSSVEFSGLSERFRLMTEQLADAQAQAVRSEKLAGIGRLAAGLAHEIRNPLGALGNYVEVLRRRGEATELTEAMAVEIGRMDGIVESLLDYARPGRPTGTADLNDVVQSTIGFLSQQGAFKGVTIETELASNLPPVMGDRQSLEQVAVNLLLNARDASPQGRIIVGTSAKTFRPRSQERRPDDRAAPDLTRRRWAPRPWRADIEVGTPGAVLFVADDGPGVPPDERERVFDPFYTTKDPGQGTGLGLAMVARSVHEAGGVVWVDRAKEGGAVFKVFLPLAGDMNADLHR